MTIDFWRRRQSPNAPELPPLATTFDLGVSLWSVDKPETIAVRLRLDDDAQTKLDAKSAATVTANSDGRWIVRVQFAVPNSRQGNGGHVMVDWTADGQAQSANFDLLLKAGSFDFDLPTAVKALEPLVARRQFYYAPSGRPVTVIMHSFFRGYERFLNGENIDPQGQQLKDLGYNSIRVWLLNTSVGRILPWEHPDFYDKIPKFMSWAARFGLYVEFTLMTQAPTLMPTLDAQQAHVSTTFNKIGQAFCFLEGFNEIDHREPDGSWTNCDVNVSKNLIVVKPDGATFDFCLGSYTADAWPDKAFKGSPLFDSTRYHSNDLSEWQRKQAHNGMEIADFFGGPNIANENQRTDKDGNVRHYYDAARGAALLSAGSCCHSPEGKDAALLSGHSLDCAAAHARGALSVDLSQRIFPYEHLSNRENAQIIRSYRRGSEIVDIGV